METEFQGTKGEWTVVKRENDYDIDTKHEAVEALATIWNSTYESKANAQLIASAPELLTALQDTQQLLEYLILAILTGKVRDTVCDANIIALSVINKALGNN